jgi:hypothetical protein
MTGMEEGQTSLNIFSASRCLRLSSSEMSTMPLEEKHIPMMMKRGYIAIYKPKSIQSWSTRPRNDTGVGESE